jgi:hypothetical protein
MLLSDEITKAIEADLREPSALSDKPNGKTGNFPSQGANKREAEPDQERDAQSRPSAGLLRINLVNGDLAQLTEEAWEAIKSSNNPPTLFRYGGMPVRVESDDNGTPISRELTESRLRHYLARNAEWGRIGKDDEFISMPPPIHVVRDVLASPNPELPVLVRIVESPIIAADGTLQTEPGYNPAGRTYYSPAPRFTVPPLPQRISSAEIQHAAGYLKTELLSDFPFTGEAELAGAIAILLLPFVRELIDGPTPLHLIEKPTPGTGATLLADVLTYPALGRAITALVEGRDEDEWRKRITARLRVGASAILIDNLRRKLDSSALSSVITSTIWEDRLMGKSDSVRIPVRCTWIATGNNPVLSSEIARRTVRIRLDAKKDRPWLREGFRHANLRAWVAENRSQLVWCALVLGMAWIQAGRPKARMPVTLGMFEEWASILGGILSLAGINGFLSNLDEFYDASDNEGALWRAFVSAWWDNFGDREVGVSELWKLVTQLDQSLDLGDKGEKSQRTRLGIMLKQVRDRQFETWRITAGRPVNGAQQWKLISVEQ